MNSSSSGNSSGNAETSSSHPLLTWLFERGWEPAGDFEGLQTLRRGETRLLWSTALASEMMKDIEAGRNLDDLIKVIEESRAENAAPVRKRSRVEEFTSLPRWICWAR